MSFHFGHFALGIAVGVVGYHFYMKYKAGQNA